MIPLHKVLMADDIAEQIKPTLSSGMITEADNVKTFEQDLEKYLGTSVLAVNSCTSAIDMALHLAGVTDGDEVITTPMTCAATNVHVVNRGAKLIWADIGRDGNVLPESVAKRYSSKTRAIMVVDWSGRPVNCDKIRAGLPRRIPIIVDAAHSFGAILNGRRSHTGPNSGDYVAWSFQAVKHLTTGDGGALKVPKDQFIRARKLRWFGIDREAKVKFRFLQDISECGYKYHMNDITARIGLANLPLAISAVEKHRTNAALLHDRLKHCRRVIIPEPSKESSWWFYSLLTPRWEEFVDFAERHGVGSGPVHGRNDAYSGMVTPKPMSLPGVDFYASHHAAIPCGWWLSESDIDKIADVVLAWDKRI